MGLQSMHRTVGLLWRLMEGDPNPAVLPARVQKVPFLSCTEKSERLPRSAPEEEGVDSAMLREFLERAAADKEENLHSMTVLRHGKVIAEYSFAPYDREIWHVTHSLCKTITAIAAGILIGEGKLRLEDRVIDILSAKCSAAARQHYGQLTVFHLLTMTSGASFNEVQSVTDEDWAEGFLNSTPLFPVGEKFHYNSMNTYMLAAIISEKSGKSLTVYLKEKLLDFMGIRQLHWETCPMGIEKGGWGLYLLQEDAAKLGQLILSRGKWNGRQLVPASYIEAMCVWHSDPPPEMGKYGYGYQCWLWERPGSIRFSGLFGQNVLVVPDLDMVIATNAGSGRMFGESAFLSSCAEFLNKTAERGIVKLHNCTDERACIAQNMYGSPCVQGILRKEKSYRISAGFARLLPVFIQLLENAYTSGISRISFLRKGVRLYIEIEESDVKNRLEVGFSEPIRNEIVLNGEVHMVCVSGRWGCMQGKSTLHVDIAFLEQASTRHMDCIFEDRENLRVRLTETPGKDALLGGAALLFGKSGLSKSLSKGRLRVRLDALAEPELIGIREKEKQYP